MSTNLPHLSHCSVNIFPCNSARYSLCIPDRRCNPSMFWLMMNFTFSKRKQLAMNEYEKGILENLWQSIRQYLLASINFFNAMCVFVGIASSKEILIAGFKPFCSNVHTPFVPLRSGKEYRWKLSVHIVLNYNCESWLVQLRHIDVYVICIRNYKFN